MLPKVFDSRDLPATDRVDAWRELTARALASNELSVDDSTGFLATLRAADMGPVQVSALTYSSLRSRRTPKLIRRFDPGVYAVGLILCGRQGIVQDEIQALPGAGDLLVYTDSRPYETLVDVSQGVAASVVVRIPRGVLPLPPARVDQLLATSLTGRAGIGALLGGFLTHLAADSGSSRPADRHRLGGVLLDLVAVWLANHLDAENQPLADSRQRVRYLEVQAFVREHLGDPDLTPSTIAAAHHMSLRSLHRLFQSHDTTVAAYIRRQRLSCAARELADPHLAARPIHAIAASLGFSRPADFTRAFRAAYGTSPTEYRRAELGTRS
ncbi:helix-turn-helix domain-containing protein [Kibdelosporangium aridum]|nr:helix-turn-helix domain-containing protein [Kibdelosporangium aridum]